MNYKLLAAVVALSLASLYFTVINVQSDLYLEWKKTYGYQWDHQQDQYRRIIFLKNLQIINSHNSDPTQSYRMAVNQFTAYTQFEFEDLFLINIEPSTQTRDITSFIIDPVQSDIDWTSKGMVSPVKNQGSCGSCWAFSAVAVLQSFALFNGKVVDLSQQQLVDCSHLYGNLGCNGGFNYRGLAYVKDHGITATSAYPYVAKNQQCQIHGGDFKISHVKTVRGCNDLHVAIQDRPVGVAVDAANWSRYGSGIFDNCGKKLDHNVLLVGLTSSYYKIKNSWGTRWGEQGYIRLALGNTCGICEDLSPWVE